MFCKQCGTQIEENSKFCSNCGSEIDKQINNKEDNGLLKLKKDLSISLPIYKELAIYSERIEKAKYLKEKRCSWIGWFCSYIQVFFPIYVVIYLLINSFVDSRLYLPILFVVSFFLNKKRWEKKKIEYGKDVEDLIQAAKKYIQGADCPELYVLPEKYRYYLAVSYVSEYLENGRVDSIKEALNLYEEEMHRWRVENSHNKIIEQLDNQQKMLELMFLFK